MKILLIGVGGVGCEFLHALSVIKGSENYLDLEIAIVDDDIVEESNLSRQRLFSSIDIGSSKVQVAAERLNRSLCIFPIKSKIESIGDLDFFEQFDAFVLAVDNLEARRWMNATIFQLKRPTFVLLDLGVQGFKSSIRMVRPGEACLECTFSLYSQEDDGDYDSLSIPVCSIYGEARNLNDCIFWSMARCANKDDLGVIYKEAKDRADLFGIDASELSFELIKKLIIKSIPAVASVNSFLASKGIELLFQNGGDDNFWMINFESGYYEFATKLEKNERCEICGKKGNDENFEYL